jgi:hypothetical protein
MSYPEKPEQKFKLIQVASGETREPFSWYPFAL